jgi:hypothetical protein
VLAGIPSSNSSSENENENENKNHNYKKDYMFRFTTKPSSYALPTVGETNVRVCKMIDLGTQKSTFNGKVKTDRKLMVYFEILSDQRKNNGAPFIITKIYTASMHKMASLRKDLEDMRGEPFTTSEANSFDAVWMLGRNFRATVGHKARGESMHACIERLAPLPNDAFCIDAVIKPIMFSLNDPDFSTYVTLSDSVRDMIEASPEWKENPAVNAWKKCAVKTSAHGIEF